MRNRVNNLLTTASWIETVKQMLGITGVSPIWDDVPAWYFWIEGAPGVYALVLEDAANDGDNSGALRALFSVKCYPFPESKEFSGFSFLERELVSSKLFDETNTPKFESREIVPSSLFVVAALEYAVDRDDRWSVLTLESPDLTRARYEAETIEDYPLIELGRFYCSGEVGREIPSWDLSYPLFDRFVSLWANYTKTKPRTVLLNTSPGYEYVFRSPNGWSCVETEGIEVRSLSILFGDALSQDETSAVEGSLLSSAGATVLYARDSQCGCSSHCHNDCKEAGYTNALWWTIPETDFESELSSPCGCT